MTGAVDERRSEARRQAEAFLAWVCRLGPADPERAFRQWARSKDFAPRAARRIAGAVRQQTRENR